MADKNPFTVEHVAPGLILECSADGELYIFNLDNGSQMTINAWLHEVATILEKRNPQKICLLLYDLRKIGTSALNMCLSEHFAKLYQTYPQRKRYTAIVLPSSAITEEIQLAFIVQSLAVPFQYPVEWMAFKSRSEAMRWLLKHTSPV